MSGFTYNGIHSSAYGVEYIPDASARWWNESDYEVYKKKVAWKNGGYIYGSAANIRTIKLNCYFEEISQATREKIRRWFGRNTKGKLVLDDFPFAYFVVTPGEIVQGKIYNDNNGTYSGTFTVSFLAEDPFGYLTRKCNMGSETDHAEDYCGLISDNDMPDAPTTGTRVFDVYNPGTEPCGLRLILAGSCSKPIRFINSRNNTQCVINSLPNNLTLDINCNDSGFVKTYTGSNENAYDNGYAYHDYGIVKLEPCETEENVAYTVTVNGTMYDIVPTGIIVTEDLVGAYIQFENPSTRNATVVSVNESSGKLTCTVSGTGTIQESGTMRISKMNHITIEEKNNSGNWVTPTSLTLSKFEIDYLPRLL